MRFLQAAMRHWIIRALHNEMHVYWERFVVQAGRRRLRNAAAANCLKLRQDNEQDLMVHMQDLLSLHRDLDEAKLVATQDRALLEKVSSECEKKLQTMHMDARERVETMSIRTCNILANKQAGLLRCFGFAAWCAAVGYRDAVNRRLNLAKAAYLALMAWKRLWGAKRRSWCLVHRLRLRRLAALCADAFRIWSVSAKHGCMLKQRLIGDRHLSLGTAFTRWEQSAQEQRLAHRIQALKIRQARTASLRRFYSGWNFNVKIILQNVKKFACCLLRRASAWQQHVLVERWKRRVSKASWKRALLLWIQRRYSMRHALRTIRQWLFLVRRRTMSRTCNKRAYLALCMRRSRLHMQRWAKYRAGRRTHSIIVTRCARKTFRQVLSGWTTWCKRCYFSRKAVASMLLRKALRSLSTSVRIWSLSTMRLVSRREQHFGLTDWNLELSDLLLLMLRVVHLWKHTTTKRCMKRNLRLKVCDKVSWPAFRSTNRFYFHGWKKWKTSRKACRWRVLTSTQRTLSLVLENLKMITRIARTHRVGIQRTQRRGAARAIRSIVRAWRHLRRIYFLLASRTYARRASFGRRWLTLYRQATQQSKARERAKSASVRSTATAREREALAIWACMCGGRTRVRGAEKLAVLALVHAVMLYLFSCRIITGLFHTRTHTHTQAHT